MNKIKVSVITPVYNRANEIKRVFLSLQKSTYKDFELILVDDGSDDNIVEVVDYYRKCMDYPITFISKENGGKHTAVNLMYDLARGEFIFCLDSDDELMPDAMEKALALWDSIPKEKQKDYWCICGRHKDSKTNKIIGEKFPENINEFHWKKAYRKASKISGDKMSLQRLEIVKEYKFPEQNNVNFITECIVWNKINNKYREYYTNEVFGRVYRDSENRLTDSKRSSQTLINNYFNLLYQINRRKELGIGYRQYIILQIRLYLNFRLVDKNMIQEMEELKTVNKIMNYLIRPIGCVLFRRFRKKYS